MVSRLKPILSVLLALVVCGASLQAAVCELSCGLDAQGTSCHMAAASHEAAMQGMPHGHCSSESAMQSAPEMHKGASIGSLYGTGCGHAFAPAVETLAVSKVRFGVAQWSLSHAAPAEGLALRHTALPHKRPPPLLASANPLLVTLRI